MWEKSDPIYREKTDKEEEKKVLNRKEKERTALIGVTFHIRKVPPK